MAPEKRDVRQLIFQYRGYTPIPFLILMVVLARPTVMSLVLGACIGAAGEALRFWGVSIVGSETRTTGRVGGTYLITTGPYAYVRNPLYVGNIMMYAGVGIMSMALFPWLLIAACAWFALQYYLIVTSEEEYLSARFGDQYAEYARNVRRFLPRLTPHKSTAGAPKSPDVREGLASERRTLQAIALITVALVAMYVVQHR